MLRKIISFFFDSAYQVVTWVWIAVSISSFFFFAGKPEGQGGRGMMWSIVSLCLSVIVMILLLAKRYFWDTDDKPIERAELFVEGARMLPLEPGKAQKILLSVRNRGKLAARNINLGAANNRYLPKTFPGPLEFEHLESDTRPDLAADAEAVMAVEAQMGINKETIRALNDGELLFFHYGKGEYSDDFGGPYPIDFCFMYTPLAPTILRTCPLRYWPKGGGPTITEKDRPELFVQQVEFETFEIGKPEMVSLQIRNRGEIAARNVTIETMHAHEPVSFEGPLVYDTLPADTHPTVEPDAVMTLVSRSPWVTTEDEFRDVMERRHLLFYYGRGHYEDDAGNSFPFSFCFMFEPSLPRNLVIAPNRYWPTDEKKGKNADSPNQ